MNFQEEALLKSDDESDAGKTNLNVNLLRPPSVSLVTDLNDDNSLLNDTLLRDTTTDAEELQPHDMAEVATVDLLDDDDDEDNDVIEVNDDSDEDDDEEDYDDDEDEELKNIKEFQTILKELEVNQYVYEKYVRLCELSQ